MNLIKYFFIIILFNYSLIFSQIKIEEIELFKSNYLASKDVNAWLGLYKVL